MKVVGLEEHYVTAEVVKAWANLDPRWQDPVVNRTAQGGVRQRLLEIGDRRFAAMDEAGIDVTVTINWPTRCAHIPIDNQAFWPVFEAKGHWGGGVARQFLTVLDEADRVKIASGNWDRMCAGIRR